MQYYLIQTKDIYVHTVISAGYISLSKLIENYGKIGKYLLFAGPTSPAEEVVDVLLEGDEGAAALVAVDWVRHPCCCRGWRDAVGSEVEEGMRKGTKNPAFYADCQPTQGWWEDGQTVERSDRSDGEGSKARFSSVQSEPWIERSKIATK